MFVKTSDSRWIYFLVLPFLCIGLLLFFNPQRDLAGIKEESEVLHPYIPSVFVVNSLSASEKNMVKTVNSLQVDQFRGNEKNQAYYRVNFSFDNSQLMPKTNLDVNANESFKAVSSPVVSEKYVLLVGNKGDVKVFDRITYALHWSFKLSGPSSEKLGTPIAFLNYAVLASADGKAYFVDLEKKSILSTLKIGTSIKTSPVFHDGFVYINSESDLKNNFLLKWDLAENKVIWTSDYVNSGSLASLAVGDESVFLSDKLGNLYSISKAAGKILWTKKLPKSNHTSPVIYKSQVIVVSKNGEIISLDQKNGEEKWRYKIIAEGALSDMAIKLNLSTGVIRSEQALYKFNLDSGERTSRLKMDFPDKSNPIIVENNQELHIFTSCRNLEVCMFRYKGPQLLRLFTIKEDIVNQLGVDKDRLLISGVTTGSISVIKKPVPRASSITN